MQVRNVPPGVIFKLASADSDGLEQQMQFIKLRSGQNAVNVANWYACRLDEDDEVVILGRTALTILKKPVN